MEAQCSFGRQHPQFTGDTVIDCPHYGYGLHEQLIVALTSRDRQIFWHEIIEIRDALRHDLEDGTEDLVLIDLE